MPPEPPLIPALTVHGGWAELIALGAKTIENRSWETTLRGPVWIHRGQHFNTASVAFARTRGVTISPNPADHPRGIIALVDVIDVCARYQCSCNSPWAIPGDCHWQFRNPRRLAQPIPCRGQQGLWWPDEATRLRLQEEAFFLADAMAQATGATP
jgi:hypothetical protein